MPERPDFPALQKSLDPVGQRRPVLLGCALPFYSLSVSSDDFALLVTLEMMSLTSV